MKELNVNKESVLKKAWLYKSFLYRKTKFISDTKDDEELNVIINALNIKKRYKRIEYIYDYCCNTIDKYNEGKNICGFIDNKCIRQQTPGCEYCNGCCRLCIHQKGKGCETSNLSCKFFYCSAVTEKYKVLKYEDFKILNLLSLRQKLMIKDNFFSTREEILKDLYYGSIIIFGVRVSIRIIRDFLILGVKRKELGI